MEGKKDRGMLFGIVAMVVAIVGTGVAFAALSTTLTFNGDAEVDPASWNVHFKGPINTVKGGAASETSTPVLSSTSINDISVVLTKPGDSVTYTFDVENTGTLDAQIGTFNAPGPLVCTAVGTNNGANDEDTVCNNVTYTVKYVSGGSNLAVGDALLKGAGNARTIEVKIEYNAAATELPEDKVTISGLDFSMNYVEKAS